MKKKLPEFMLRKKYSSYFLFFDNEVFYNIKFYNKLKQFSKLNVGTEIFVEVLDEELLDNNIWRIPNYESYSLEKLSEIRVENLNCAVEDLMFEFYIYDDTGSWEIYCNIGHDIGIAGCDETVEISFMEVIKPYEILSFSDKLNNFKTFNTKKLDYAKILSSNYYFKQILK